MGKLCGSRKRILWLQSAFHDAALAAPHMSYENVSSVMSWLEHSVLRPGERAFFLKRQLAFFQESGRVKVGNLFANVERYISESRQAGENQQMEVQKSRGVLGGGEHRDRGDSRRDTGDDRSVWRVVDCDEAFSCHVPRLDTLGLGGHLGAIARGFMDTAFPNYYLSVLQTSLALRATFF
jgi:hypothetical protein